MSERYPTDEELGRVRSWPVDDIPGWFAFVRSIWWNPEWGWKQDGRALHISTGGWSGNEDLIGAMQGNPVLWSLCWQLSKRGGHYEFELPEWAAPDASSTTPPPNIVGSVKVRYGKPERSKPRRWDVDEEEG